MQNAQILLLLDLKDICIFITVPPLPLRCFLHDRAPSVALVLIFYDFFMLVFRYSPMGTAILDKGMEILYKDPKTLLI